jgi:hypothetical protein
MDTLSRKDRTMPLAQIPADSLGTATGLQAAGWQKLDTVAARDERDARFPLERWFSEDVVCVALALNNGLFEVYAPPGAR